MTDFFASAARGVQHSDLRAANRRAVLSAIAFNPGLSNADISRMTGLAPQTASAIVADLEDSGLILRGDVLRGRRGQPATPLSLNHAAGYTIGVEVNWDHVEIVLVDYGANELARYRRDYAYPDFRSIATEVHKAVASLTERLDARQRQRILMLGLAMPNELHRNLHLIGAPADQIEGWKTIDLRAQIEAKTGLHTSIHNDGTAACWAEMLTHPAPRPPGYAYLYIGTFLGSALIIEPMLRGGPPDTPSILGSMLVIGEDGARYVGHQVASLTPVRAALERRGIAPPLSSPRDWPWEDWQDVVDRWVDCAGKALAAIVMNTRAVVDVNLAVIDGEIPAEILHRLVKATERELALLPAMTHDRPRLAAGHLGTRAASLGAATLPLVQRLFSSEATALA
jgi:predicted NBD/HSP70 family sugar kinase